MDFQFYQVEEEKHYNVCNNTFTFEERVFKSIRLNKDNYKLRKPQQVFDDISYFLNMRVEYCKNNYKGYCENNFSVNFDFFPFTGELENPIDLNLFDAYFSMLRVLRTKSVTKKEMNKCMAEIYDPGGTRTRAARLISQYHNH